MHVSCWYDEETSCWKPPRCCFVDGIAHTGVDLSRKHRYIAIIWVCMGRHHPAFVEMDTKRVVDRLIEWANKKHPLSAGRDIGR